MNFDYLILALNNLKHHGNYVAGGSSLTGGSVSLGGSSTVSMGACPFEGGWR